MNKRKISTEERQIIHEKLDSELNQVPCYGDVHLTATFRKQLMFVISGSEDRSKVELDVAQEEGGRDEY